jgi:hypothetical protein
MSRILITNGGPHPPEKWAMTTAERIFDIGSTITGDRLLQAQKFQIAIAEVLLPHHDKIQTTERQKLSDNTKNILAPYKVTSYLDAIMKDIKRIAKGTPWQKHFATPAVVAAVRNVIAGDIATELHVERLWHADHHPEDVESRAYCDAFKST